MVIYDQILSERLLQFNDVCRCQLVIADDVGFAKALNRVLFGNINGVGVADVVEIVHEWLPLYMLTCAHIEQRLMPNPQRFEGLEEDKITGFSSKYLTPICRALGLEEDKIAGFSNNASIRSKQSNALEAKELQGTQTAVCEAVRAILVWKGIELQGAQIPLRDESSQPSFESGRNYRALKRKVLWF